MQSPFSFQEAAMTGRARGRSRGRARAAQAAEPAPRPGAPPTREEAPQVAPAPHVARGRGRGAAQAAVAAPPPQQQADVSKLGEKMSAMAVGGAAGGGAAGGGAAGGGAAEERPQRGVSEESLVTKPANVAELTGSYGRQLKVRTNYFRLIQHADFQGFFQYQVKYTPEIESRNLKFMLLKDHAELLGTVRAFDGMILYLPHQLPELETTLMSTRRSDGSSVEIKIKYTNKFPFNSPTTMQLLNILFRR